MARRRAVAHGEACLSPVAHALGTLATAHHCSRCALAGTFNVDIEGRLMDARLDTEFWRERLQSRRARRAAPFMVTGTRGCGELLASWPEARIKIN